MAIVLFFLFPARTSALSRADRQWKRLHRRLHWNVNSTAFQTYVEEYRGTGNHFRSAVLRVPETHSLSLASTLPLDSASSKPEWIEEIISFAKQPLHESPADPMSNIIDHLTRGGKELSVRQAYFEPLYTPDPENLPASWSNLVAIGSLASAREKDPNPGPPQSEPVNPIEKGLDFEVTPEELPKETSRIWIID